MLAQGILSGRLDQPVLPSLSMQGTCPELSCSQLPADPSNNVCVLVFAMRTFVHTDTSDMFGQRREGTARRMTESILGPTYMHMQLYVRIFVYLYIYIFVYLYICKFVCLYICILVYLYICIFVYLYICILVYLKICIFVYLHISVFVYCEVDQHWTCTKPMQSQPGHAVLRLRESKHLCSYA